MNNNTLQAILDELLTVPGQKIMLFVENGTAQRQAYFAAWRYLREKHLAGASTRSHWLLLDNGTRIEFWCRSVPEHNRYSRHSGSYDRVIDL